jgi:hypothetical protein
MLTFQVKEFPKGTSLLSRFNMPHWCLTTSDTTFLHSTFNLPHQCLTTSDISLAWKYYDCVGIIRCEKHPKATDLRIKSSQTLTNQVHFPCHCRRFHWTYISKRSKNSQDIWAENWRITSQKIQYIRKKNLVCIQSPQRRESYSLWAWVAHLTPQMLCFYRCENWVAHLVTCSHSFSSRQAADVILKFHELALTPTADWKKQAYSWLVAKRLKKNYVDFPQLSGPVFPSNEHTSYRPYLLLHRSNHCTGKSPHNHIACWIYFTMVLVPWERFNSVNSSRKHPSIYSRESPNGNETLKRRGGHDMNQHTNDK